MIDYISGPIAELNPAQAVIDCGGIGYEINITLIDFTEIQGNKTALFYVEEAIREDAHILYGFLTKRSRTLFRLLTGVSGVGPNTARLIMSALKAADLEAVISSGNDKALKAVKGIGAKTAQRIIVDLRDKIKPQGDSLMLQTADASEAYDEALSALVTLGFSRPASEKALKKIFGDTPSASVEQAIKNALKML